MKKCMSIVLCLLCLLGYCTPIYATMAPESTSLMLYNKEVIVDITVPSVLPIVMDSEGNAVISDEMSIVNNGEEKVSINNVKVELTNGWDIVEYDTDFKSFGVGTKELGLRINDFEVNLDGEVILGDEEYFGLIDSNGGEFLIDLDANICSQADIINEVLGVLIYNVDWIEDLNKAYTLTVISDYWVLDGPGEYISGSEVTVSVDIMGPLSEDFIVSSEFKTKDGYEIEVEGVEEEFSPSCVYYITFIMPAEDIDLYTSVIKNPIVVEVVPMIVE